MIRKCVSQSGKLLRWTNYACIYSNTDQLELSIKTKCLHFTSRIHSLFKVTRFMVYLVGVHIHLEPMQTHDYCCYAGSVVQFLLPSHHPQVGACMYLTCISTNNKIFKPLKASQLLATQILQSLILCCYCIIIITVLRNCMVWVVFR